jgi:quinol-cytochrome oxidoreductase complex cytochrome b subunit
VPFLDRSPYRSPKRRRVVIAIGAIGAIGAVALVIYALVTVPQAHIQGAM